MAAQVKSNSVERQAIRKRLLVLELDKKRFFVLIQEIFCSHAIIPEKLLLQD